MVYFDTLPLPLPLPLFTNIEVTSFYICNHDSWLARCNSFVRFKLLVFPINYSNAGIRPEYNHLSPAPIFCKDTNLLIIPQKKECQNHHCRMNSSHVHPPLVKVIAFAITFEIAARGSQWPRGGIANPPHRHCGLDPQSHPTITVFTFLQRF